MKTLRSEEETLTGSMRSSCPVLPMQQPSHKLESLSKRDNPDNNLVQPVARTGVPDSPFVLIIKGLNASKLLKLLPRVLFAIVSLSLLIGTWYLGTKFSIDWYIRFDNIPTPGDVLSELNKLGRQDIFYTDMMISLRRIVFGFGIATVLGIVLGILIGRFRLVRQLLFPALEVLRPIPAIAWVPMSIMLWPTSESSILFITFIGSFFPILLNTIDGVESVDPVLVRAARSLGASEFNVLRLVILNGAMPQIFTGLAVGMGVAWVSLIAAEMISGQFGIGYFTWESYSLVEYPDIVIGMGLIGVLGLLCSGVIRLVGNLMMPWVKLRTGGAH